MPSKLSTCCLAAAAMLGFALEDAQVLVQQAPPPGIDHPEDETLTSSIEKQVKYVADKVARRAINQTMTAEKSLKAKVHHDIVDMRKRVKRASMDEGRRIRKHLDRKVLSSMDRAKAKWQQYLDNQDAKEQHARDVMWQHMYNRTLGPEEQARWDEHVAKERMKAEEMENKKVAKEMREERRERRREERQQAQEEEAKKMEEEARELAAEMANITISSNSSNASQAVTSNVSSNASSLKAQWKNLAAILMRSKSVAHVRK